VAREVYRHAELGHALAWLRDRARLTQAAAAQGAGVSRIYLQKLEAGERSPSTDRLHALLDALGSSPEELDGLLAARPWAATPPRPRVRSRAPAAYVAAAEEALSAEPWSSPVELVEDRRLTGELAELRDLYLNLSPERRQSLLEEARRLRWGRKRSQRPGPRA
jgi:transcriptional regulator with XRE-family HTH domain